MKADFAGFASVSGASENKLWQVLANFTQANIGSVGNAKSLIFAKVGNASNTKSLMQENIGDTDNAKSLMQTNFSGMGNAKNSMFANVSRADNVESFILENVGSVGSAMNLNALNLAKMQGNAVSLNAMYAVFANALNLMSLNIAKTGVSSIINTAKASILGRISLSLSLSRLVRFFYFVIYFFNPLNLFTRFCLFVRRKFVNFAQKFKTMAIFAKKFKKFTTFINFPQISTQNDFKILKNSTHRSQNDTF